MVGNIIPYIGGEEEKSEKGASYESGERSKMALSNRLRDLLSPASVSVFRYLNGHTAAVFVKFKKKPTKEQLIEKLE